MKCYVKQRRTQQANVHNLMITGVFFNLIIAVTATHWQYAPVHLSIPIYSRRDDVIVCYFC